MVVRIDPDGSARSDPMLAQVFAHETHSFTRDPTPPEPTGGRRS
jgi:hypothetical protein